MVKWLVEPEDFPTREEALAIIAALELGQAGTFTELATLSGVPTAYDVAHRAFLVYGYPQLEGYRIAHALNGVFMAPRRPKASPKVTPKGTDTLPSADFSPGFTPRR